jgi:hypothetical protein
VAAANSGGGSVMVMSGAVLAGAVLAASYMRGVLKA